MEIRRSKSGLQQVARDVARRSLLGLLFAPSSKGSPALKVSVLDSLSDLKEFMPLNTARSEITAQKAL